MTLYTVIAASSLSFVVTFYLIPFLRSIAFKTGTLDIPNGVLKKHEQPTPYLGGVGVFLGCMVSVFYFLPQGIFPLFFFLGLSCLLLVGLVDDIYAITPLKKFLGQTIACFCFLKAGLYFNKEVFLYLLPSALQMPRFIAVLNTFFSSWWMLTVINAFNLVDVMDGLSTIIAYAASLSFIGIACLTKNYGMAVWLGALFGSLGAFFHYNKPPRALIYLGDAGSLFIGGSLATAPFFLEWGSSTRGTMFVPLFILMVPLVELCSLIFIRTYKGILFYHGSPHHFICYLKARGWSVYRIIGFSGVVGSCCGGVAFLITCRDVALPTTLFLFALLVFLWLRMVFYGYKKSSFF